MKANKSPESTEVTPSKKKLKQARLPFMLISDVSPKAAAPQARKRKLSVADAEPAAKPGKIIKENDSKEELVILSDDDNNETVEPQQLDKPLNPYVNLVDAARKKKLQKTKAPKKSKKSTKKTTSKQVASKENLTENEHDQEDNDVEMVEVIVQIHEDEADDVVELENHSSPKSNNNVSANGDTKQKPTSSEIQEQVTSTPQQQDPETSTKRQTRGNKTINSDQSPETGNKGKRVRSSKSPKVPTSKSFTDNESIDLTEKSSKEPDLEDTSNHIVESQKVNEVISIEDSNDIPELIADEQTSNNLENNSKTESSDTQSESNATSQETVTKPVEQAVTPKRSARNKKPDERPNMNASLISSASSKLDDSMSSTPSTPKQDKSSVNLDDSIDPMANISASNLTPKQLQKRLEIAKKKDEREKEKQEREKKRQQEKEERARQKAEKEEQKKKEREEKEEARRKEKEEKEEQKRKEKEEKERQKEMQKKEREEKEEQKRKEREDKEEQRRKEKEAREEERRKRQEALELEKQEQELKKKKAAEAFVNFFVPKQKVEKDQTVGPVSKNSMLSSFTIKADMRLAPTNRVNLTEEKRQALDKILEVQDFSDGLYLKQLKNGTCKPMSSGKTWPLSDKDYEDVMIVEDELPPIDSTGEIVTCDAVPCEKLRPKLLSFHGNRRPPYWGTWRKKSAFVKPRRPFGQEKQLDYEVDSDDDWEEEQEGESLDGSVCGSEDEGGADDYEIDNEVFVPHGYLSDEEATMDEDDVLSLTPETQKARLKHLEDEFETELKKPTEKLKPRLYGLLWENADGGKPDNCVDALWNYFGKFSMIMEDVTPLLQPANEPEESEKKKVKKKKVITEGEEQSPKSEKKKKAKSENKESKKLKAEPKKAVANQPGINSFLTKIKST